jgi:hypothetical protein
MPGMATAGTAAPGRDIRDRLILALYAQLKAERETREALEYVIRKGAVSPEVLEAIAGDPVPVVTEADVAAVEQVIAFDLRKRARAALQDQDKEIRS